MGSRAREINQQGVMMLKFKEYLTEMFLLEGKIDDLKAQNPNLHRVIDAYAVADPTSTKKFVP